MKTETLHKIVDMVTRAAYMESAREFHMDVEIDDILSLSVSRNPLTGGKGLYYATVPVTFGIADYSRAEDWQTLADVADRIAVLSE